MYHFKPMMPFWGRFVHAETDWLMSQEGRTLIAKAIWHCRKRHGRAEARRFLDGLTVVGCIYPQIFPRQA